MGCAQGISSLNLSVIGQLDGSAIALETAIGIVCTDWSDKSLTSQLVHYMVRGPSLTKDGALR